MCNRSPRRRGEMREYEEINEEIMAKKYPILMKDINKDRSHGPSYLSNLISYYSPPCPLSSSHTNLLSIPQTCHALSLLRADVLAVPGPSSGWLLLWGRFQFKHHLFTELSCDHPK